MNSSANTSVTAAADEGIDIVALWWLVWRYRLLIALTCVVFIIGAVVLALTATPIYRAEVVVTEVRDSGGMGGLASLASQLGPLASLAGVNFSASGSNREASAVLQSRHLVEEFVKRNQLQHKLLPQASEPPTLWSAVNRFRAGVLTIREDARKGITTIAAKWSDPAVAAAWANAFVALANEVIRRRAIDNATRNIAYLQDQLANTDVVEIERVMYNLIESETKTLMLANGRVEYAFTVVDPAVAPELRISPRRTMMVMVGAVLGVVVGILIALFHGLFTRLRAAKAPVPSALSG